MRMLGPPTPDTRNPITVGATPALTLYPTTCTKTTTPPPMPAHSLQHPRHKPAAAHHRRPSLTTACLASVLPPPTNPRPQPPSPLASMHPALSTATLSTSPDLPTNPPPPLPSLPLPLAAHSLPIPAPPFTVNPTGFAGTRRPAPPQAPQSSPLVRCPHRPFSPAAHRRPQPDRHNLTHRQGPNGLRFSRTRSERSERSVSAATACWAAFVNPLFYMSRLL